MRGKFLDHYGYHIFTLLKKTPLCSLGDLYLYAVIAHNLPHVAFPCNMVHI